MDVRDGSAVVVPLDRRKLTAIVYADMVGYSRLIGLDDANVLGRLRELRCDLIDPAMGRHGGILVNTAGDSLLITFDSILSAVRFAVDMQRGVLDYDGDYAPDRRLRFRMGVNVGDVIPDGTNLYGEGVNIAARLQALCPPGGICVTRVVRDHVGNRLGLGFKELGAIGLKNIAQPTEAYLLELTPSFENSARVRTPAWRSRPSMAISIAIVVAGFVVSASVFDKVGRNHQSMVSQQEARQPESANNAMPPLSIAVLPFANLSGDPEQTYLADGISEDLTTDLSHLDNAFVIARESAFTYRGKSVDVRDVGRQLGVRYVLEGSVRKINAYVRITAQLVATDTGAQLWAEHFDKQMTELGTGQDDIIARVASALNVRMVNVESTRRNRSQNGSPASFDLILRARSVMLEPASMDRYVIALGLYLQALRADPNSVPAMAGAAAMFASGYTSFINADRYELIRRATELVTTAEQRAPASPDVLVAKFLLLQNGLHNAEALDTYRRLLDVDSSVTSTLLQFGLCCWIDDAAAIPLLQKTIQLNPRSSGVRLLRTWLARTLLLAGKAEEARDLLQQTLALPPFLASMSPSQEDSGERWRDMARVYLAIADVRTQHIDEAQAVIKQAMEAPSMKEASVRWFTRNLREYENEDKVAQERRFADDLRRAGMRDHLDEDAESIVPSTSELQDLAHINHPTPTSIPGGRMVRTPEVVDLLAHAKPLILTTSLLEPTIPGAIHVRAPETGSLMDEWQSNLNRMMQELSQGNLQRPIIVFAVNINRWIGRNLALRLIALGYTNVNWYRGGWEAWEASGQPRGPLYGRRDL